MFKSIILCFLIVFTLADKCPQPDVFPNLDVSQYLGKWYEIERFPFVLEENLRCLTAEYTLIDSKTVKVNNSGYDIHSGQFNDQIGKAVIEDPSVPSKLTVIFFNFVSSPYWVIQTNYNYSLVYSCTNVFGTYLEYAWILSRERTLDDTTVNALKSKLASYKIDVSKFERANQTSCN